MDCRATDGGTPPYTCGLQNPPRESPREIEGATPGIRSGALRREHPVRNNRLPVHGDRRTREGGPDRELRLVLPPGDFLVVPRGDVHVPRRDHILEESLTRSRVQPDVDEPEAVSPRLPRVPVFLEEGPVLRGAPLREPSVVERKGDPLDPATQVRGGAVEHDRSLRARLVRDHKRLPRGYVRDDVADIEVLL